MCILQKTRRVNVVQKRVAYYSRRSVLPSVCASFGFVQSWSGFELVRSAIRARSVGGEGPPVPISACAVNGFRDAFYLNAWTI